MKLNLNILTGSLILFMIEVKCSNPIGQVRRIRRSKSLDNKVTDIETSCLNGEMSVKVETKKPFSGAIYARGYPNECRIDGDGQIHTKLNVSSQKCGIKVMEDMDGSHKYKLMIYIQFDPWVQQVTDEQRHVQCILDSNTENNIHQQVRINSKMGVFNFEDDDRSENIITPKVTTPSAKNGYITLASKLRAQTKTTINDHIISALKKSPKIIDDMYSTPTTMTTMEGDVKVRKNSKLLKSSRRVNSKISDVDNDVEEADWDVIQDTNVITKNSNNNADAVSAWMDILDGSTIFGKPVTTSVEVGEDITMVIKVRQEFGLDTRITSCIAHDGSGDNYQELVDDNGCAVDDNIMPPLRVKRVKSSPVKVLFSTFKAFKFPDRNNLHLKCTVLICLGGCSLPTCGRTVANGDANGNTRMGRNMEEPVGTGTIIPVEDIINSGDLNQVSNLKVSRGNSRLTEGRVVDKVEVFNSVEVRASNIEENQENQIQFIRDDKYEFFDDEDSLFCLTPYKMVLSFGVLLTIIVAALLFSLYSCVKDRRQKKNFGAPSPRTYYGSHRNYPVPNMAGQFGTIDPRRGGESAISSPYYRFFR